jgi:hypothetical protein
MFRAGFVAMSHFPRLAALFAQSEQQDQASQILKLAGLAENKRYREAINGYRLLIARPGTPGRLKVDCEYQIAALPAALRETESAVASLIGAVRPGFDDSIAAFSRERLRPILHDPRATGALAEMKITEADYRELVWLKAEAQHARHGSRRMILENTNRLDPDATAIPQAQSPVRPTTSAAAMYRREQVLLCQRLQREFVMKADVQRIRHAATMAALRGVSAQVAFEPARRARLVAEARKLEIRERAFVPPAGSPDPPRPCSEWPPGPAPAPVR